MASSSLSPATAAVPGLDVPVRKTGGILFGLRPRLPDDLVENINPHTQFTGGVFPAALVGDLGELRQLIDQGVAIGIVGGHGRSPDIMSACQFDSGGRPARTQASTRMRWRRMDDQSVLVPRASARHQARSRAGSGWEAGRS